MTPRSPVSKYLGGVAAGDGGSAPSHARHGARAWI